MREEEKRISKLVTFKKRKLRSMLQRARIARRCYSTSLLNSPLKTVDPAVFDIIEHEKQRQRESIGKERIREDVQGKPLLELKPHCLSLP